MMKQFFCLQVLFFLALLGATDKHIAYANSELVIQGKIMQMDGSQPGSQTVHLMQITMSDEPSIKPVTSVQSDAAGNYKLSYSPETTNEERVFYRVSVDYGGQAIGSDPFHASGSKQSLTINLSLPAMKQGIQHLSTPKEVVIVESMEKNIRITNILYIVNRTTALIDAKKIPFEKPIPESAFNVRQLGPPGSADLAVEPGRVLIGVSMPEGTKQVFFSYDLPVSGSSLSLDFPLMKGVGELELTTPEQHLELKVNQGFSGEMELISQQKKMGGRMFYSQIVKTGTEGNIVPITISGLPISQSSLIIPAIILFMVLITGLAVYLARNKQAFPAVS
ncbi:MAG: hypothetical protein MJE63_11180 [Proteobacteria bacterium]|nr:hypothetical protein [Pseudomonadota bacterium]